MRAAVYHGRCDVRLEDVPEPRARAGEVKLRVRYNGICGSDLHVVYHGVMPRPFPQVPGYPGHEGIGEVLESRHPDFKPGDRVLCCPGPLVSATFAEIQAIPGRYCIKVPKSDLPLPELPSSSATGSHAASTASTPP